MCRDPKELLNPVRVGQSVRVERLDLDSSTAGSNRGALKLVQMLDAEVKRLFSQRMYIDGRR